MIKRVGALIGSVIVGFGICGALSGCQSETYVPPEKTPVISSPVIMQEGTLTVGVNGNDTPFAVAGSSGIVGINVDIAAAIADELGLNVSIVDISDDPAGALEEGRVDIVVGVERLANTTSYWQSDPYLESGVAVYAASADTALPTDSSSRIAAQTSSMSEFEVTRQYGQEALATTSDLRTAFSDLSNGLVDYVAADSIIGLFAAKQASVEAHPVGRLQNQPKQYAVGVAESNTELTQLVSETLARLAGNGMIDLIERKFLGTALDYSALPLSPTAQVTADENNDTALTNELDGTGQPDASDPNATLPDDSGSDGLEDEDGSADQSSVEDTAGTNAVPQPGSAAA